MGCIGPDYLFPPIRQEAVAVARFNEVSECTDNVDSLLQYLALAGTRDRSVQVKSANWHNSIILFR